DQLYSNKLLACYWSCDCCFILVEEDYA
ncbi:hypothetical protein GCK32_021085, partial [Trichostrongylus colubriformis]